MHSHTLTVLFADLVGSTRLYETLGDTQAHQRVTDSLKRMALVVENHSGRLLKTVGDAVMASFQSTDGAYLAAVDIQKEHARLDVSVTVGFHFGEVIPDAGDVYGNAVNVAARVASFAEANEIYTTEASVLQLSEQYRYNAQRLDEVDFKGVSKPMAVYRIHWGNDKSETTIMTAISLVDQSTVSTVLNLQLGGTCISVSKDNPVVTLGRDSANMMIVDTESVSRNHAKIELVRGRYLLHDFSTNGTYVTSSGAPTFVRRESISINGSGSIRLGFSPESDSQFIIQFNVSSD
ncbi:MAG: adenylate/guanylate cyclase domain-containing protein [Granulosicoccus sp.]